MVQGPGPYFTNLTVFVIDTGMSNENNYLYLKLMMLWNKNYISFVAKPAAAKAVSDLRYNYT